MRECYFGRSHPYQRRSRRDHHRYINIVPICVLPTTYSDERRNNEYNMPFKRCMLSYINNDNFHQYSLRSDGNAVRAVLPFCLTTVPTIYFLPKNLLKNSRIRQIKRHFVSGISPCPSLSTSIHSAPTQILEATNVKLRLPPVED